MYLQYMVSPTLYKNMKLVFIILSKFLKNALYVILNHLSIHLKMNFDLTLKKTKNPNHILQTNC